MMWPMTLRWWVLAALMTSVGCGKQPGPARAVDAGAAASKRPDPAQPVMHHGIAWYEDRTIEALAEAKARKQLVLVDLWAPWCHTCLSMREYVLTAANLAGLREQFVFLAINTERKQNAALLSSLSIGAWPTFYVIDDERTVYGRWVGAASPTQLTTFLRDALKARRARGTEARASDAASALLVFADRFLAKEQLTEARDHYRRALAGAEPSWPRRPDALVSLASTLRRLNEPRTCLVLGLSALAQTGMSASVTDFSYHVLDCAKTLEGKDARVRVLRTRVERRLETLCDEGSPELTPDDRGDACGLLHEVREQLGDEVGARAALTTRLAVLEAAAEGLPDQVAMTYDLGRMESLLGLGRGEEAVALLEAREAALPDDYNPPHHLARAYRDLKRFDAGLAAIERALAKAEGPRRAGMLGLKVDLLVGAGRKADARKVLELQLAAYRALPAGQKQPAREAKVLERLTAWK